MKRMIEHRSNAITETVPTRGGTMTPFLFIAAIVFATTFVFSLRNLMRGIRNATEATVQLALHMQVSIATAGSKEIYLKAPLGVVTWGAVD